MAGFIRLYELWTADDQRFDFDIRRCRYAETYREMGLGDIGHLMACNRDGTFCQGYDRRITLQRKQTIMQGAACCTFRYQWEPAAEGEAPGLT